MVHSRSWIFPETVPADSDKVGKGDDEFRDISDDVAQRQIEGGQDWGNSTTTDGRHFAHATGATPGFKVYKSNKTDTLLNFSDTAATLDAAATYVGGNVTTGTDPGHKHTGAIAVRVSGALTTGRVKMSFRAPRALTFTKCSLVVFTVPTVASVVIDAYKIEAGDLDVGDNPGTLGTSIWNVTPANRPTILVGNFRGSTTSFDSTTMIANDELVFEITATGFGAAADLTIQLDVT